MRLPKLRRQKLRQRRGVTGLPEQVAFPHAAHSLSFYKIVLHSTCMDVCMGIVYRIIHLRACARACARDGTPGKLPASENHQCCPGGGGGNVEVIRWASFLSSSEGCGNPDDR